MYRFFGHPSLFSIDSSLNVDEVRVTNNEALTVLNSWNFQLPFFKALDPDLDFGHLTSKGTTTNILYHRSVVRKDDPTGIS